MRKLDLTIGGMLVGEVDFAGAGANEKAEINTANSTSWFKSKHLYFVSRKGYAFIHVKTQENEMLATFGPFDITQPIAFLIAFSSARTAKVSQKTKQTQLKAIGR